jgi:hypothetical protein
VRDTFVVRDRRPGYLKVYNDLFDKFGPTLGPYGLAAYMALCRHADNETSECFPSYGTIARETGMSRRKAIYEIQKMEQLGVLGVERNHHTSNVFVLLDTSALHAPLSGASPAPSDAQPAPKQSPTKKNTHHRSSKKGNYSDIPDDDDASRRKQYTNY